MTVTAAVQNTARCCAWDIIITVTVRGCIDPWTIQTVWIERWMYTRWVRWTVWKNRTTFFRWWTVDGAIRHQIHISWYVFLVCSVHFFRTLLDQKNQITFFSSTRPSNDLFACLFSIFKSFITFNAIKCSDTKETTTVLNNNDRCNFLNHYSFCLLSAFFSYSHTLLDTWICFLLTLAAQKIDREKNLDRSECVEFRGVFLLNCENGLTQ